MASPAGPIPKSPSPGSAKSRRPGKISAAVSLRLPKDKEARFRLSVGEQSREASARGTGEAQSITFGEFNIAQSRVTRDFNSFR